MTVEEQAHKLMKRFKSVANGAIGSETLRKNCRRSALILVDAIIELDIMEDHKFTKAYWEQVKQEILKT